MRSVWLEYEIVIRIRSERQSDAVAFASWLRQHFEPGASDPERRPTLKGALRIDSMTMEEALTQGMGPAGGGAVRRQEITASLEEIRTEAEELLAHDAKRPRPYGKARAIRMASQILHLLDLLDSHSVRGSRSKVQ